MLEYSSEIFFFMLIGEDGSRCFGYCRCLLLSGKGFWLLEVYCVISCFGCFGLFFKVLDEVECWCGIFVVLVYFFMRSFMELFFLVLGKIIKVKIFLLGVGNEVLELWWFMDLWLEYVDFECFFICFSVC